ncbi:hypothetical protein [uncultured Ruminococcus sp.]|uniref:hypothetical protein n=1 Tax=uncultured Ruminococcus sp. TaxID=165186 RepID=UPI0025D86367|nr:hypothetical protein [uncultured Ruminococcus sp.]
MAWRRNGNAQAGCSGGRKKAAGYFMLLKGCSGGALKRYELAFSHIGYVGKYGAFSDTIT